MKPVSIIIPLFNRWDLTAECLAHLAGTTPWGEPGVEVILVDNGSTDATRTQAAADVVVKNYFNRGFAVACNQGAGVAQYGTLVFLNNDTVPQPGWLEALVAPLEEEPPEDVPDPIEAVGARLVFPDGRIQHAGVALHEPDGILTAYNVETDEPSRMVPAVTGACMAVRARTFAALGGFDAGFWNGYEDVDFCLRLGALGGEVWYESQSTVMHYGSASGPERWTAVQANIDRLQTKWKEGCYGDG